MKLIKLETPSQVTTFKDQKEKERKKVCTGVMSCGDVEVPVWIRGFWGRQAAGGILQLHHLGIGNRCTKPPGTWQRLGKYGLGEEGVLGKMGALGGQNMGNGIQIGEVSGWKSLALHVTELLGLTGLATPEL